MMSNLLKVTQLLNVTQFFSQQDLCPLGSADSSAKNSKWKRKEINAVRQAFPSLFC